MSYVASSKGIVTPLITALTTGTGVGVTVPITSKNLRVHVRGVGVIASGTVVIEEAQDPSYTGTWSTIYTATPATDSCQVIHLLATVSAIRARLTANIVGGGTVTVELVSD
jgi:hypothetical protein